MPFVEVAVNARPLGVAEVTIKATTLFVEAPAAEAAVCATGTPPPAIGMVLVVLLSVEVIPVAAASLSVTVNYPAIPVVVT